MYVPCALAVLLAIGALGVGAADLGAPASALRVKEWVKGGPVDVMAGRGTNIYVVEFWATWCGPCLRTIPHLTELQKRFKDRAVTFVGISDETAAKVKPFVEKQAGKMDYAVAIDDGGKTVQAYMQAYGATGIPHAFVVDREGRIAWHGHPLDGLDTVIEDILANRHDLEALRRGNELIAIANGYFEKLLGADPKSARDDGDRLLKDGAGNARLLAQVAWAILTHPKIPAPARDLDLAAQLSKAAYDRTGGKDAGITDVHARALFVGGRVKEAVEFQRKAIEAAPDAPTRAQLERTLAEYTTRLP